jgi:hypothetical protein
MIAIYRETKRGCSHVLWKEIVLASHASFMVLFLLCYKPARYIWLYLTCCIRYYRYLAWLCAVHTIAVLDMLPFKQLLIRYYDRENLQRDETGVFTCALEGNSSGITCVIHGVIFALLQTQ